MQQEKYSKESLAAVQDFANNLVKKYGTQSAAAASIGVSDAHFMSFRRGDWDKISDALFNTIAAKAGVSEWRLVNTKNLQQVMGVLDAAQTRGKMIGLVGNPGYGKTEAATRYASQMPGSAYILADAEITKSRFLLAIMRELGLKPPPAGGIIPGDMIDEIVATLLSSSNKPCLIIDDAGKMRAELFRIIQIIYDRTKDRCGIVLIGTPFLINMLNRKVRNDAMGFRELMRRFAYWECLDPITDRDVSEVCKQNGVTDADAIKYLCNIVQDYAALNFLITEATERMGGKTDQINREILVAMRKGRMY